MGWIQADGREDGLEFAVEVLAKPAFLIGVPAAALQEANAFGFKQRKQHLVENPVLLVHHFMGQAGHPAQLRRRRKVVRAVLPRPQRLLLLQASDANLEELV